MTDFANWVEPFMPEVAGKARNLNYGCPAGMPGSAPSFGSGPEHVLPGGRAMAAPLGGGEYVQDKRSPGNRIEPHTMPRPTASLADPPLVSHLRLSSVMQPDAQAAESRKHIELACPGKRTAVAVRHLVTSGCLSIIWGLCAL